MGQTYTSSSHRVSWKIVSFVMLGAMLGAELGARVIEPMLPPLRGWPSAQMASKVDQMEDLSVRSVDVDVVFLGSSSMDQAVNPIVFNTTGERLVSYNASFSGASLRSLDLWAREVVLPALDPELVVIGLTTRELNDGGRRNDALFEQLVTSSGLRRHRSAEVVDPLALAEDLSALLRIRTALRKPFSFGLRLTGGNEGEALSLPGPFGSRVPEPRDFSYDFGDEWRVEWTSGAMLEFAMGGAELQALEQLVDELISQGRRVALMVLPVSSDYIAVQPGGTSSITQFRGLLSKVAASRGIELIQPSVQFQNDDFRDPAHLGPVAAEEFSKLVALAVADLTMQAIGHSKPR
jgi:hypothetical protein